MIDKEEYVEKIQSSLIEKDNLEIELDMEIRTLLDLETDYRNKSSSLLLNTDFKEKFGKDNEKLRDAYINQELADEYEQVLIGRKNVELLKRKISNINDQIVFEYYILTQMED